MTKALSPTASFPWLALGAMLLGATGIAFAPILVRLSEVGPTATAFWRCFLAIPLIWLLLYAQERRTSSIMGGEGRKALWLAGAFFAIDLSLWHTSILWTSVANATLLANLAPFFTAGLSVLIFRVKLGRATVLALMCAAFGVLLLTSRNVSLGGERLAGDMLGVATALAYASYMLAVQKARRGASAMRVNLYTSTVATLCLAGVMLVLGEDIWPDSLVGWLPLLALAAISQVAGQGLIVYAFAHLPVTFGALSLLLQPVLAALAAWALFGEAMAGIEILGGAIVLMAILIARLDVKKGG